MSARLPTDKLDLSRLRADVELCRRLTGTVHADTAPGYCPAMNRIFAAVEALVDEHRAETDAGT